MKTYDLCAANSANTSGNPFQERRFSHNYLTGFKSLPFQRGFLIGEDAEVPPWQIGRVGSLSNKWGVGFWIMWVELSFMGKNTK